MASEQRSGYFSYAGFRALENLPGNNPYLFLAHCGEERCAPGHAFGELRDEFHIHFVMSGKGTLEMDGNVYHLGRGDIFVIPYQRENYYYADQEDPWHYAWVAVNGSRVWETLLQAGFERHRCTRRCGAPPEQYYTLIQEILEARNLTYANELHRTSRLYAIFSLLMRTQPLGPGEGGASDYPRSVHVNRAVQYLQTNYRSATIAGMTEHVGLHRSYLAMLFHQETGMTPREYLTHLRMEKAARMLEGGPYPIQEIAAAVGYDDPLAFSKAFKRQYGQSPRFYRNANKNVHNAR